MHCDDITSHVRDVMAGALATANISRATSVVLLRLDEVDRLFGKSAFLDDLSATPRPSYKAQPLPQHMAR